MAVRSGRFSPSPYEHFNALRAREGTPPKARPVPDHLLGSPARIPSHEKALHTRRSGRRWLTGRMVRMQAMEDMRPRESRVRKRREQDFDARCPDSDQMKGCIPQLNASGSTHASRALCPTRLPVPLSNRLRADCCLAPPLQGRSRCDAEACQSYGTRPLCPHESTNVRRPLARRSALPASAAAAAAVPPRVCADTERLTTTMPSSSSSMQRSDRLARSPSCLPSINLGSQAFDRQRQSLG